VPQEVASGWGNGEKLRGSNPYNEGRRGRRKDDEDKGAALPDSPGGPAMRKGLGVEGTKHCGRVRAMDVGRRRKSKTCLIRS